MTLEEENMNCNGIIFTAFLSCLVLTNQVQCQHWDNVSHLTSSLLTGYDKRLRPVLDQSESVKLNVTFDLISLQDFDELKGKFSVVGIVLMTWVDENLQWEPSEESNITNLMLPISDIWYPRLIMVNPFTKLDDLAADWMTARVYYDGTVMYAPGSVFHSTCSADVTYYPLDQQTCEMTFIAWSFERQEITFISPVNHAFQTYFNDNGEWHLDHTTAMAYQRDVYDFISFGFHIQRKPKFIVINVILPMVFMATINILVFVIPAGSGERVSYAVTVLLALAVFLTLVGENLPKTSEPMPILSYYLTAILSLSTLLCIVTIINQHIFYKAGKSKPPKWCQRLISCCCCRGNQCGSGRVGRETPEFHPDTTENHPTKTPALHDTISGTGDDVSNVTWEDVARAVDIVSIVGFTIAALVVNVYYANLFLSTQTTSC